MWPLTVDLIYDIVAGEVLTRSAASAKPGGALVSIVGPPPTDRHDIRTIAFVRDASGVQLRKIGRLVDKGVLHSQVDAVSARRNAQGLHGQVHGAHTGKGRPDAPTLS